MARAKRWRAEITGKARGVKQGGSRAGRPARVRAPRDRCVRRGPRAKPGALPMPSAPERKMQAVVLAGGLATRMRPRTLTVPKSMLEVAGRPFVDWQIERLVSAGVPDVVMVIAH